MTKDESTMDQVARAKLREIEDSATELVELGDLLFRGGAPSDPALLRAWYRLYTRVKAALALPLGPERIPALQAAKIDRKALTKAAP